MTNKKANQFTKGEWVVTMDDDGSFGITCENCFITYAFDIDTYSKPKENAQLIATAGTTATKLAEMGYDAMEIIKCTPALIEMMSSNGLECLIDPFKAK